MEEEGPLRESSEQEEFWRQDFGVDYIERNGSDQLLASNLALFSKILASSDYPKSVLELGANIGMNLRALQLLFPDQKHSAVEINPQACDRLSNVIGEENAFLGSILDVTLDEKFDLVFTKGVLIHINPEHLTAVYKRMFDWSNRYVLMIEYFNPTPVTVSYRGHEDRLFKRDFAGEFMDIYPDFSLVDYGFSYRRDPCHPQDDVTWFLMERTQ